MSASMSVFYSPPQKKVTYHTSRDESGKQVDKYCGAPQSKSSGDSITSNHNYIVLDIS